MKKIMLTGGGSAGHVTVNLALIPRLREAGWAVQYIGSSDGIEKQLVAAIPNLTYHSVSAGKLRRYMDWKNIKDPFKVVRGAWQAFHLIRKEKPDIVFSKGGFVSVPVVLGAWMNKVPVIIHESDVTPGLANRISIPFATRVCTTFQETENFLPKGKTYFVGPIIREELKGGKAERGRFLCGFTGNRPVLLIMGGSLGAQKINQAVREAMGKLSEKFQIVHLCGKGQLESSVRAGSYRQFEYIQDELPDILAMCDIVVTRAGANSIFELLTLRKPMLLIPLTKEQSRGDQLVNAETFRVAGYGEVLHEEELTPATLESGIDHVWENRERYVNHMNQFKPRDALSLVMDLILKSSK